MALTLEQRNEAAAAANAGRAARLQGIPQEQCPFRSGHKQSGWLFGWGQSTVEEPAPVEPAVQPEPEKSSRKKRKGIWSA